MRRRRAQAGDETRNADAGSNRRALAVKEALGGKNSGEALPADTGGIQQDVAHRSRAALNAQIRLAP